MRERQASGFTLIELVAVLVILGLVAASVTLRLQGPLARATMSDLTGEVQAFDARSRHLARTQDRPVRIEVDLAAGEVRRTDPETREALGSTLTVPPGYTVTRVLTAGEDAGAGQATIHVSRQGRSASYALCLTDAEGRRAWIVTAGLSGESTVLHDSSYSAEDWTAESIMAAVGEVRGK
jgi:prepilin-type N-terminal cleavage/methylation domain-containing protein